MLARIKAVTGREVTVGGGVGLRIGLTPRIVADDVRLANAPWAKAPYFVTAKHLEMQVALLPLLRRRFELVRLNVVEPVIALETAADGRNNWDLGDAPQHGGAADSRDETWRVRAGRSRRCTRGELTYRDASGGEATQVTIDEFSLKAPDRQSQVTTEFGHGRRHAPWRSPAASGPIATLLRSRDAVSGALKGEVAERGRRPSLFD